METSLEKVVKGVKEQGRVAKRPPGDLGTSRGGSGLGAFAAGFRGGGDGVWSGR